jgi:proteasome lid subunit RPN8/RPN11
MSSARVSFAPDAEAEIRGHGARAYPHECCGALLGRTDGARKMVVGVIALENARTENRERRFLVDDSDYLRVEKEADRRGLALLGFYHSHPDHPAAPSATDLEQAFPWFSTVILSVRGGKPEALTSWILDEDRARFLEETIVPNEGAS